MERRVFEGTWEEIARRGHELAGHRVRLTVLDERATPEGLPQGNSPEGAAESKPSLEDLIDHDAIAYCERAADDTITLEEVRAATAKIQDSMARVVIEEERAERF